MATLSDIGVAAGINLLSAFIFFIAFDILRLQPFNDRVYFPKWYLKGLRSSPSRSGSFVKKFVNLDFRSYSRFLNWMPEALKMPELELIDHAGLDSAVYLRIYLIGLKIFVPITFLAWAILVPVNYTNKALELQLKNFTSSDIDKLSISNIPDGSDSSRSMRKLRICGCIFLRRRNAGQISLPKFIKSVIQGFIPGIALKLFLIFLPTILMIMSKFEGFTSISSLERRSATRYYLFNLVNVFLGSVIAGSAMEQLDTFIKQSANEDFDAETAYILSLEDFFLVKTEKDREEAMGPGSLGFNTGEPRIQLYFLLAMVYATVTPAALPFIVVFFGLAYVVFRHQIINVYNQEYESAAAFWPDVHGRIIIALLVSHVALIGLLSTKHLAQSAPLLVALAVLTIWFYTFCKARYEPAFVRYPLQEAMMKDTLERAREPNFNLKPYLQNAYIHLVFKDNDDEVEEQFSNKLEDESVLVPTKRQSRRNTPVPSKISGASSPSFPEAVPECSVS
ncbi:CSC1-like protein [Hibiscus syriacus]|uniref:CSC1-like protein n=1 Tax=Hibiscus syriacus TaxID=106335 RepID=A0A6A2WJM2_HIBSY|nr:CSC1-like protein [Hibiscus syriacus]